MRESAQETTEQNTRPHPRIPVHGLAMIEPKSVNLSENQEDTSYLDQPCCCRTPRAWLQTIIFIAIARYLDSALFPGSGCLINSVSRCCYQRINQFCETQAGQALIQSTSDSLADRCYSTGP